MVLFKIGPSREKGKLQLILSRGYNSTVSSKLSIVKFTPNLTATFFLTLQVTGSLRNGRQCKSSLPLPLPRKASGIGFKFKISISDLKNLSALNFTYLWIVVNKFLINKFLIELYLARSLITLSPNGPFASNSCFSKVAIIKTKSATIAFFSSPSFLPLALSFSPLLFLRYYHFGASRA